MTEPFVFANGQTANNAKDLIELCQKFPADSINYLIKEDFEKWLVYIGKPDLAKYAIEARQSQYDDRQKLDLFVAKSLDKSPKIDRFWNKILRPLNKIFGNRFKPDNNRLQT